MSGQCLGEEEDRSIRDRVRLVDALRGFAILLMLLQHFPLYLMKGVRGSGFYTFAFALSRLSAPMFFLLVGYCVALSARRRSAKYGRKGFFTHILGRSFLLFMLGYLVNLFRLEDPFGLNVIHLISFFVFISGMLYLLGSRFACFAALAVLFLLSFLGQDFRLTGLAADPIGWLVTTGEFPVARWLIYSIIGLGVDLFSGRQRFSSSVLFLFGEGMIAVSVFLTLAGYPPAFAGFLQNAPPFLFAVLGTLLILYCILEYLEGASKAIFAIEALATYGRHSLTIYVVHQFLIIFIPCAAGFRNTLDIYGTLLAYLAFLVLAYMVIRKYESSRRA